MAKKKRTDGPTIIKKYANRRLYDTSTSSYVTLEHLSELVRKGVEFEVRDAKSGEDLTRAVLTQIIFEKETKGDGALPLNFLRQLIGFYGGGAQTMLPAWLDMSMNSFAESQERMRNALGGASPMALFEKQAKRNAAMFENALRMFMPGVGPTDSMRTRREDHERDDTDDGSEEPLDPLSAMQNQMAEMQRQLETLAKQGKS
ncbi:MAG: polyhydroxyalkanoate synthesis repressor PhaR [Pseudomonadota bacterium]